MIGIVLGVLLILGGICWMGLVAMDCGSPSTRPTDAAPALLGIAAIAVGIILIVVGIFGG